MNPHVLDGHRLVFLLILYDEAGKKLEDGHLMRTGTCHWDGEELWVDWGEGNQDPPYPLGAEHWDRIAPVPTEQFAEETGADYYLVFAVEPLSEDDERSGKYHLLWRNPNAPSSDEPS